MTKSSLVIDMECYLGDKLRERRKMVKYPVLWLLRILWGSRKSEPQSCGRIYVFLCWVIPKSARLVKVS